MDQHLLTNDKIQALNTIFHISYFPFSILNKREILYKQAAFSAITSILEDARIYDSLHSGTSIVYEEDNPYIYYYLENITGDLECLLGPFSMRKVDHHILHSYIKKHKIDAASNFYIPVASINQVMEAASLIGAIILSDDFNINHISTEHSLKQTEEMPISEYALTSMRLDYAERNIPHVPSNLEMKIIDALMKGDEQKFYQSLQETAAYESAEYHLSPLKTIEYSTVSIIAILTRALISRHISPVDAYNLSDMLLSRMSNLRTANDFDKFLYSTVFPSFMHLVRSQITSNEPPIIGDCKSYVLHHLNQPLSLDLIAKEIGVSKNYLSSFFHQTEGMTLTDYIHKERIQASANMLKYSDYSILQIANYFQYQTQGHFGVVFKRYMQISPAAYRKQNQILEKFNL
ncbi:MAG: AraC family transcriptional regulator [Lachnospiraceae bacterium]|nr:AraC family transcriptional regulator [Lachnospiraceae bacterium]